MSNLSVINNISENFVVNKETGEISISYRKCAELLGVAHSSLHGFKVKIFNTSRTPKYDEYQNVTSEKENLSNTLIDEDLFFNMVEYYAFESKAKTEKALTLYRQIAKAGTRAFLYSLAGYTFNINEPKKKPKSLESDDFKEKMRKIKLEEAMLKLEALNNKVEAEKSKEFAKKLKYDNQTEILKIKHYATVEALTTKHAIILSKPDVKIRADLVVGKIVAPISTITDLLKKYAPNIKAKDFNAALVKHGILNPNRKSITKEGTYYGRDHKSKDSSPYSMPRWFEHDFPKLLEKVKSLEPDLFIIK